MGGVLRHACKEPTNQSCTSPFARKQQGAFVG
jgi:hypothetical protein